MSDEGGEKVLGMKLQKARQAAGFTQQELCQKSGLSYSTLAKIERGAIKSPSIFTVQQIAAAVGTSVDGLLGVPSAVSTKKTSKSGISFVYFDIHGCLIRFFQRAFVAIAQETGVPSDIVESTYWHYNDAVCRGDISLDEFNGAMAKQFGVPSFDWSKYYLKTVDQVDETAELLRWASEHYRVGLFSNIMPGLIDAMRERNLIPNINYDAIVDSSVVHAIKPEPAIYEIAQQKAGVSQDQILLIDDSRANLMSAERLGWRVLWIDDYRPAETVERAKRILEF